MKNKIFVISTTVLLLLSTACEDFLDKNPLDKPSTENFPQTQEELLMGINATYRNFWYTAPGIGKSSWWYVYDHMADVGWERNLSDCQLIANGNHASTTYFFSHFWDHRYTAIAKCNYLLTNMEKAKAVTDPEFYSQVDGQARFIRAFWYWELSYLFGNVPLIIKPLGLEDDLFVSNGNKEQTVDFLLSDLDIAISELPVSWDKNDQGRATKGAALTLKARIALFDQRWDIAVQATQEVMQLNMYHLYPNYRELFTYAGESCSEVIFEIMFQYGIKDHRDGRCFFPRNAKGHSNKVPIQAIVDSYECTDGKMIDQSPLYDPAIPFKNRDPRLDQSIVLPGTIMAGFQFETYKDSLECWNYNTDPPVRIGNQDVLNPYATFSGYLWRKRTDIADLQYLSNSSLNWIMMRYAEVLLMYAEAKIELNQIDQSVYDAINQIRGRESVLMPPIEIGKTQAEMRKIIRQERKIELLCEGLRLFDIRRWRIAEKCMSGPLFGRPQKPYNYADQGIPTFDENGIPNHDAYKDKLTVIEIRTFDPNRDYLWPFPQKEIDVNPNLVQNPGY
ncbi:MAG: RagB/SusD family nutrient uptake outer membrane protein [Bacteroidales bacterium]|nr:RagB/SusD family nutrient uptake outer membrane protein [Bacteroidales bacterium]